MGLVRAVGALRESGLQRYVIVGGVAVAARLGQAHRATTDVDTVIDEVAHPDAVEALIALPNAQPDPSAAHRVLVAGTKVELIGVGPTDETSFDGMTELQTLFVASHTWALETATPLTLVAAGRPHSPGHGTLCLSGGTLRHEAACNPRSPPHQSSGEARQ